MKSIKDEIKSFLSHPVSLSEALAEVEKLKPLFKSLAVDCTIGMEQIESMLNFLELGINWPLCAADIASLAAPITKLTIDAIHKDLTGIIGDLSSIVPIAGKCISDCFGQTS